MEALEEAVWTFAVVKRALAALELALCARLLRTVKRVISSRLADVVPEHALEHDEALEEAYEALTWGAALVSAERGDAALAAEVARAADFEAVCALTEPAEDELVAEVTLLDLKDPVWVVAGSAFVWCDWVDVFDWVDCPVPAAPDPGSPVAARASPGANASVQTSTSVAANTPRATRALNKEPQTKKEPAVWGAATRERRVWEYA